VVNLPDLAIPTVINPENTRCICLQIPDDEIWITNFVNLLSIPTFWFNWQRTGDNTGKQLADVWFNLFVDIDWSVMSCCCNQPPAIFRYNDSGVYQMSTDGGATWTDAPGYDYRNTSTTFPPPSALGISNTKCQAADSAVKIINDQIVQAMDDSFGVAQILALIAAVLLAVLSAGSLAALTPLIAAIGAAIIDVGVAATKAAFTTAVLNRLRCNIYNHMDSDSSIDMAGWSAVLVQLGTDETGIVESVLYSIINAAGHIGLTNMIRSNAGAADADCSGCAPPACHADDWNVYVGTEISRTDTTLTVQTALQSGFQTVNISTADSSKCCHVSVSVIGWGSYAYINCGQPIDNDHIINNGDLTDNCLTWFNMANSPGNTVTNVTFTFSDCP